MGMPDPRRLGLSSESRSECTLSLPLFVLGLPTADYSIPVDMVTAPRLLSGEACSWGASCPRKGSNPPSLTQSPYPKRPSFQPARADPGMLS